MHYRKYNELLSFALLFFIFFRGLFLVFFGFIFFGGYMNKKEILNKFQSCLDVVKEDCLEHGED